MRFWFEIKLACFLCGLILALLLWVYFFPPDIRNLYENTGKLPSFREIKHDFSTGDIILMSGNTYGEKIVRWGTGCPWNHVGIVVVKPGNMDTLWLWECDIGQGFVPGVRLVPLPLKLSKFRNGLRIGAWIKLSTPHRITYEKLKPFLKKEMGKEIEMTYYSYLLSGITDQNNSAKYYCSELAAKTYQNLGLMPRDANIRALSPKNFFERDLRLTSGTSLEEPILFKF